MSRFLILALISTILSSACVSSKKFSDMEVLKEYYKLKGDTLILVQNQNKTLGAQLNRTSSQLSNKTQELKTLQASYVDLENKFDKLNFSYQQLQSASEQQSLNMGSEMETIERQLREVNSENASMRAVIENLDASYQLNENKGVATIEPFEYKLKRLQEMSETITAENSQLTNLYNLLAPLPFFAEEGLDIIFRPDRVVIVLSSDKVYRTGKYALNTKGRNVIAEITGVISRNSNLNVVVEGHTDATGSDFSNWNLSTNRAASVVKEMIKNEFVPERLFPIGRSSHEPLVTGESSSARKKNRRVELIIKSTTSGL